MSAFPPELEDIVIQHLHGQTSSLAACGLVNRGWMEMSRPILFGTVALRDNKWERFLGLLDEQGSTVVHAVRCLSISRPESDMDSPDPFFTQLVHRLSGLENLRALRVFHVPWIGVSSGQIDTFTTVFSGITDLVLSNTTFDSPYDFVSLLGRLPQLEAIALHASFLNDAPQEGAPGHVSSLTQAAISGPQPPRDLAIIRLKIRSNEGDPFTYIALWLAGRPPPIRVVEAGILWPSSMPGVGFLCSSLGPQLRELDLKLLNHVTANEVQAHLKLAQNTNLEHLTLHIGLRRFHAPSMRPHAPWAVLGALTSDEVATKAGTLRAAALSPSGSVLKSLTLVLFIDFIYMLDSLDWPHLNAALRRELHPHLSQLNFQVHCHNTISEDGKLVGKELRKNVSEEVKERVGIDVEVVFNPRLFTHPITGTRGSGVW